MLEGLKRKFRLVRLPIANQYLLLGLIIASFVTAGAALAIWGLNDVRHHLQHHERWDGSGYPGRLRDGDIALLARIIGVADSFDAMLSNRPYRRALPLTKVLEEIEAGAGKQFDPKVASVFLRLSRERFASMVGSA